ncbi:hypothetical protein MMC14_000570 [Varicellaria rhodocarpa]|nr:hypothetical protein [Varicellaria rhodocarpa]
MTALAERRELSNIEFVFTIEDMASDPNNALWALTRLVQDHGIWLMPDFGFWSWNVEGIGPYGQVVSEIFSQDIDQEWKNKERKLMWREKLSFAPKLRRALIEVAKNKPWSAVRALQWKSEDSMREDFVSPVDQCNYMFIAHAEGRFRSSNVKLQNFVEVERDFSDLDAKMEHLLAHPEEAKRVADNSVKTFRERYLTPAAEACY